jgi:hypothetical protein
MAKNEKRVSLRPEDAVQGGLIEDVDVTFKAAGFQLFDYNGKADPWVCLRIDMEDSEGDLHEQFFSAANPDHFAPSSDGDYIVSTGEKGSLNKGSNYIEFMTSLINAGFPSPALDEGISAIVGTKVHVVRRPATVRRGIINQAGGENQREKTVLEVSKILELPEALRGKGAKAAKGGTKTTTATASGKTNGKAKQVEESELDEDDVTLAEYVKELLAEADGEDIKVTDLVQKVFAGYPKGENKKAATKRVIKEDFLQAAASAGYFLYADGEVSAVPE